MYELIESPIDYGGLTLKNRIIFAPTTFGLPQTEMIARLAKIAAGGCAMIIVGDVPVLPHGFGPSLYTKKGAAFYRRWQTLYTPTAAGSVHSCTSLTLISRGCFGICPVC